MSYDDIYLNTHASLLSMCNEFISDNSLLDWVVFDFDAHATLNDLPNNDLIGIAEYSIMDMKTMFTGECSIIISTKQDDINLDDLRPVTSKMFNRVGVLKETALKDASTGDELGTIVFKEGSYVASVARTEARPMVMINISFGVTLSMIP